MVDVRSVIGGQWLVISALFIINSYIGGMMWASCPTIWSYINTDYKVQKPDFVGCDALIAPRGVLNWNIFVGG